MQKDYHHTPTGFLINAGPYLPPMPDAPPPTLSNA